MLAICMLSLGKERTRAMAKLLQLPMQMFQVQQRLPVLQLQSQVVRGHNSQNF